MKNQIMLRSNIQIFCLTLSISLSSLPAFAALETVGSGEMSPIDEQLFKAIKENKPEAIEKLLNEGARLSVRDRHGYMPLHRAVKVGHKGIVKLLLERRADISSKSLEKHDMPLHIAAEKGYSDIVELLLDNNANIEDRTSCWHTALLVAIWRGDEKVIRSPQWHPSMYREDENLVKIFKGKKRPLAINQEKEVLQARGRQDVVVTLLRRGAQIDGDTFKVAFDRPIKEPALIHILILHHDLNLGVTEIRERFIQHKELFRECFDNYWEQLKALFKLHCPLPPVLTNVIYEYSGYHPNCPLYTHCLKKVESSVQIT